NVLLRGESRIRIEAEVPTDTLYRVAAATTLVDEGADAPGLDELADKVRDRCVQILEALGRASGDMRASLQAVRSPAELGDPVACGGLREADVGQALLEEVHVARRLERLAAALDHLLKQLSQGR